MSIGLLDIVRPGVGLLDGEDWDWVFIGKRAPSEKGAATQKWQDKWLRQDDSKEILSLEDILAKYSPVAVIIQNLHPDYRWWDETKTFESTGEDQ